MYPCSIPTPAGRFLAVFSANGLSALRFPGGAIGDGPRRRGPPPAPGLPLRRWCSLVRRALRAALVGRRPGPLPPLDLSRGTAFQQAVWQALGGIPPGETRTYAQLAALVRRPRAARAVGQACGANPIPVLLPCHRVLAAQGRLGGFSGGLGWKQRLLAGEGVVPRTAPRARNPARQPRSMRSPRRDHGGGGAGQ